MKEIEITFGTITPLWTGDAWGKNPKIKASSIMGSLRFWFEVICYFSGITKNENYEKGMLEDNLNEEKFRKKLLSNGTNFMDIDKSLSECGISLPSRIFGCTGWKGWIRIKKIEPIKNYCFGNMLNLPFGIAIKKENFSEIKELNNFRELNKSNYSRWFFSKPYFYGKFKIIFEIEENIIESIFCPLLVFIEKYGFLGGKWNIGYGRVEIEKVQSKEYEKFKNVDEWKREKFICSSFYKNNNEKFSDLNFSSLCKSESSWNNLEDNKEKAIYYCEYEASLNSYKEIIKELIKTKASHRRDILNKEKRHEVFGESGKSAKGTKIIPWIYKNSDSELKGGFISVAGITNLEK